METPVVDSDVEASRERIRGAGLYDRGGRAPRRRTAREGLHGREGPANEKKMCHKIAALLTRASKAWAGPMLACKHTQGV